MGGISRQVVKSNGYRRVKTYDDLVKWRNKIIEDNDTK